MRALEARLAKLEARRARRRHAGAIAVDDIRDDLAVDRAIKAQLAAGHGDGGLGFLVVPREIRDVDVWEAKVGADKGGFRSASSA